MDEQPQPQKKRTKGELILWITTGCVVFWFLIVRPAEVFLGMIFKIDTVQLDHGYKLEIYQDCDIYQLYAELHGPSVKSTRSMLLSLCQRDEPPFLAHTTADGNIGWITTSSPGLLILIIDYRNGDYWLAGQQSTWSEENAISISTGFTRKAAAASIPRFKDTVSELHRRNQDDDAKKSR